MPLDQSIVDFLESIRDPKAGLKEQIIALEQQQARPLRELALGDQTALERLEVIEAAIVAIRATLDA